MVIVRFKGGLGNQFFQYAAARALAHRHETALRFDLRWYADPQNQQTVFRSLDLGAFSITGAEASPADLARFFAGDRRWFTRVKGLMYRRLLRREMLSDHSLSWNPAFTRLGSEVFLEGYFQHPRYFTSIKDELRNELRLSSPVPDSIAEKGRSLRSMPSVCIQVRRSDLVLNLDAAKIHGTCKVDYYRAAWDHIKRYVPDAKGFVFSDDLAWAMEIFSEWPDIIIMGSDWDGPSFLYKFYLMCACRHFIIANSTWGWWAVWLSHSDGIVVAPRQWRVDATIDELGLSMPRWIVL